MSNSAESNLSEPAVPTLVWDFFWGRVSTNLAHLYVRVSGDLAGERPVLRGFVRGPRCRHSRTLPAQFPLRDLGPGPTCLAEARVTDPAFWSPELPALYDLHLELCSDGRMLHQIRGKIGIRRLGCVGSYLRLEQERWVPRGLYVSSATAEELAVAREHEVALLCDDPPDTLCAEAAEQGVFIVARIGRSQPQSELRRLSRWASVGIVVLPQFSPSQVTELRQQFPNLLFARSVQSRQYQGEDAGTDRADDAAYDLELCEVEDLFAYRHRSSTSGKPVLLLRRLAEPVTIVTARAACDRLQRDVAPPGDEAGYFVAAD